MPWGDQFPVAHSQCTCKRRTGTASRTCELQIPSSSTMINMLTIPALTGVVAHCKEKLNAKNSTYFGQLFKPAASQSCHHSSWRCTAGRRELMSQHLDVATVERAATHQSTCCKAMIISSLKLLSPKGLANAWLHTPYIFDAHCDDVALKDTSNALSTRKTARTRGHADRLESHQHDLSGG